MSAVEDLVVAPAAELQTYAVSPIEAYERGRIDVNFFAALAMPEVCIYALPYFYVQIWQVLVNRDPKDMGKILRFALGLPRGHAKTTFVKILLAWLIAYDRVTFVLIICATEDNAENLLSDLNDILGSANMEEVYGRWVPALKDTVDLKKAIYHNRPVVLAAKGAKSALRGLNIKNHRPDCILCDDMQTRENDESPTESAALIRWMIATLLKVIAPRGDRLILYVGNMYSDHCILKKLQDNPGWISLITGAILADGKPLWPELHSLEELMDSFYHDESMGLSDLWFAEVMNDPKDSATSLLPVALPQVDPYLVEEWDATYITIDPAGFRKHSDNNEIILHGVRDGMGHVLARIHHLKKPDDIVMAAINLAIDSGACLIGVESTGYQQTLGYWITFFMGQLHIEDITVVELAPHRRSKESRIRTFIQECYAGNYCVYNPETRAAFIWQAMKYKIGEKENKDDLLDACAYGIDVRNEYGLLLTSPRERRHVEPIGIVENNTPF